MLPLVLAPPAGCRAVPEGVVTLTAVDPADCELGNVFFEKHLHLILIIEEVDLYI